MANTPTKKGAGRKAAELFTAAGGSSAAARPNVVKRLMHGGFSLTVTFWIFCVSVPLVGHLLFSRVLFPLLDAHTWYGSTALLAWPLLVLLYGAVTSLGLWRSRAGFRGHPLWSRLAGPAALLAAALFAAYAAMMAGSWFMLVSA